MKNKLIELLKTQVGHTLSIITSDEIIEELADFLLDYGVILPPVKVGQSVYAYCDELHRVLKYNVDNLEIMYLDENTNVYQYIAGCVENGECLDEIDFEPDDIGKTVFLTEEEAQNDILKKTAGYCK